MGVSEAEGRHVVNKVANRLNKILIRISGPARVPWQTRRPFPTPYRPYR